MLADLEKDWSVISPDSLSESWPDTITENEGIISAVGNTPLIRLNRVFPNLNFRLYAKLEALNPGGSMKDRAALSIIRHGIETGQIGPNSVIIESSSGNMGIGLAQACAYFKLRFICVVDTKATSQNLRLLEAYGADVDLVTEPDRRAAIGLALDAARPGDAVVIAGKGHETTQTVAGESRPFDDREAARQLLEAGR